MFFPPFCADTTKFFFLYMYIYSLFPVFKLVGL